jgi:hypothetical protein
MVKNLNKKFNLEIGDWRLETGDWRLESGDWRLGIIYRSLTPDKPAPEPTALKYSAPV